MKQVTGITSWLGEDDFHLAPKSVTLAEHPMAQGQFGAIYPIVSVDNRPLTFDLVAKVLFPGSSERGFETTQKLQRHCLATNQRRRAVGRPALQDVPGLIALPRFSCRGIVNHASVAVIGMLRLDTYGYRSFDDILERNDLFADYHKKLTIAKRIELAFYLVEAFGLLRDQDFIHADLNPKNIFINLDTPSLAIIDFDSGVVTDRPGQSPMTYGKKMDGEWQGFEIIRQSNTRRNSDRVTVNLLTDMWSVVVGIHYLLFLHGPLMFLSQISERALEEYFRVFRWPNCDASFKYFRRDLDRRYQTYLSELRGAAVTPLYQHFEHSINEGLLQPNRRIPYSQWKNHLRLCLTVAPHEIADLRRSRKSAGPLQSPVKTPVRQSQGSSPPTFPGQPRQAPAGASVHVGPPSFPPRQVIPPAISLRPKAQSIPRKPSVGGNSRSVRRVLVTLLTSMLIGMFIIAVLVNLPKTPTTVETRGSSVVSPTATQNTALQNNGPSDAKGDVITQKVSGKSDSERGLTKQDIAAAHSLAFSELRRTESEYDYPTMLYWGKELASQHPTSALAMRRLGDAYYYLKRNEEALATFEKAVETDPKNVRGYDDLAIILKALGRRDAALSSLKKGIELGPNDAKVWIDYALFVAESDKATALAGLRHALVLLKDGKGVDNESDNYPLLQNATWGLAGLGFAEEAYKLSVDAVQKQPNSADAQNNLAILYYEGEGVAKDRTQAVKWFRKAAEQGLKNAQLYLGHCYASGDGVAKDEVEAIKWLRKAAEQNVATAQTDLGTAYYNGKGVAKDEVEAIKWFRKAAEQNLALAQYNLSYCYASGRGVAKDDVKAIKWLRKAAEQNLALAQYDLSYCYATGRGVAKDEVEAIKWLRKAAEQNVATAQTDLGTAYYNGKGVAKDEVEGVKWFRKAAEQHLALAQYNLGHCYATGRGVPKDEVEGYKWWLLAAERGNQEARKAIPLVESKMTPQQIATGQKLARAFKQQETTSAGSNTSPAVEQTPVSQTTNGIEEGPTPASNSIRYRVVNVAQGDFLNIRAGPRSDSPVLATLTPNDTAIQLGPGRVANGPTVWQEVTPPGLGKSGWVNADYLTAEIPQTSLTASSSRPSKAAPDIPPADDTLYRPSRERESFLSLTDKESRVRAAERLRELGVAADPERESFLSLTDKESRVRAAGHLHDLGHDVDWQTTSFLDMTDMESRITASRRLRDLGYSLDWKTHSFLDMTDMESRIRAARRLRDKGVSVDWQKYSFMELIDMESQARRTR